MLIQDGSCNFTAQSKNDAYDENEKMVKQSQESKKSQNFSKYGDNKNMRQKEAQSSKESERHLYGTVLQYLF